jgi:hypothetical protein
MASSWRICWQTPHCHDADLHHLYAGTAGGKLLSTLPRSEIAELTGYNGQNDRKAEPPAWLQAGGSAVTAQAGRRALHDAEDLQRGKLRIAMTPTFTTYMLGPLVENYYRGQRMTAAHHQREGFRQQRMNDNIPGAAFVKGNAVCSVANSALP